MQRRNTLIALAIIVIGAVAWYAFRPERLFINKTVNEGFASTSTVAMSAETEAAKAAPTALASGRFHSNAHETTGEATIYQLAGGKQLLRLTGFETSNGPDVHVYLVAAPDSNDNEVVKQAGFIDLGSMKGNKGDQNYDLPPAIDLNKYRSVSIWCARFGVNFGSAALAAPAAMPMKLAEGSFHGVAHETKGTAAIYQLPEGKKVLRFSGFQTSNGPDVQVYLVAAPDANDNDIVTKAGFIRIADLKGNMGDQNYELPAGVDLNKYRSVTIWCRRFGVNFATAPLTSAKS